MVFRSTVRVRMRNSLLQSYARRGITRRPLCQQQRDDDINPSSNCKTYLQPIGANSSVCGHPGSYNIPTRTHNIIFPSSPRFDAFAADRICCCNVAKSQRIVHCRTSQECVQGEGKGCMLYPHRLLLLFSAGVREVNILPGMPIYVISRSSIYSFILWRTFVFYR